MKKKKLRIYLFLIVMISFLLEKVSGQQAQKQDYFDFQQTVNDVKSGNSQDILSNLFQLGLNNLLGDDKSFDFDLTLYGIDSLLFINHRSAVDNQYAKQRILRHIELNGSIKADDNNEISIITGGATFALINKKDITYADFSDELVPKINHAEDLRKQINLRIQTNEGDEVIQTISKSWHYCDSVHNYKTLDPRIIIALNAIAPNDTDVYRLGGDVYQAYKNLAELYSRKPLLTVAPKFSYDRIQNQPKYSLEADFTVGLGKNIDRKPWEVELKGTFSLDNDSTLVGSNLQNQFSSFSAGLNKILRQNKDQESTVELKGFFQYGYQFGNVPQGTEAGTLTFNSTLRIKIFHSLWVPLTLSYDIQNPNLLGFLSLTANIDNGNSSSK